MPRLILGGCLVILCLLAGCAGRRCGEGNLTVRTTGDAQVYGVYRSHMY